MLLALKVQVSGPSLVHMGPVKYILVRCMVLLHVQGYTGMFLVVAIVCLFKSSVEQRFGSVPLPDSFACFHLQNEASVSLITVNGLNQEWVKYSQYPGHPLPPGPEEGQLCHPQLRSATAGAGLGQTGYRLLCTCPLTSIPTTTQIPVDAVAVKSWHHGLWHLGPNRMGWDAVCQVAVPLSYRNEPLPLQRYREVSPC